MDEEQLRAALDELAQALSVIAPLSTRVRQTLADQVEDVVALEIAAHRAVRILKSLQPKEEQ